MTRRRANGFTLVEVSIVFLIISLLLGSGLSVFSAQVDRQKFENTRQTLDDAAAALTGYAASVTPPHLPCPDKTAAAGVGTANDGQEDRNPAGTCVAQEGNLPWITLGLPGTDAWSRRIRYRVTPAFSDSATGMQLTSVGTLNVENRDTTPASGAAANVPVVLVSHGKNGSGAISSGGIAIAAPVGADELENTDGDDLFVTRGPVDNPAAPGGEFDDIVTWLSARVLLNRMLEAGKF